MSHCGISFNFFALAWIVAIFLGVGLGYLKWGGK